MDAAYAPNTAFESTAVDSRLSDASFRFDNSLADHMVLQRAPARAAVYGNVNEGTVVTVSFEGKTYVTTAYNKDGVGRWKVVALVSIAST